MTNRILVKLDSGTPVFKASIPGVDVNYASYSQLIFDMGAGGYGGIFLSGAVTSGSFVSGGSEPNVYGYGPSTPTYYADVLFGRTFTDPPKALISVEDPILGSGWRSPGYNAITGDNNRVNVWIEPATDRLRIWTSQLGSYFSRPSQISYVVFYF